MRSDFASMSFSYFVSMNLRFPTGSEALEEVKEKYQKMSYARKSPKCGIKIQDLGDFLWNFAQMYGFWGTFGRFSNRRTVPLL